MITERQAAANRRNARDHATGPRTPEGKARSSQNAIKHAGYARTNRAVTAGPFAEDDDDIEAFLVAIIERLDPMDALQRSLATRIAGIHLKMSRLEIYEAVALRGGARFPGRSGRRLLDDAELEALNEEVVARHAIEEVMDPTLRLWSSLYRQLRIAMDEYARLAKLRAHASTLDTLYDDEFYRGMSPAEREQHARGEAEAALRRVERFSAEAGHPQRFEIVPVAPTRSGEPTVADLTRRSAVPQPNLFDV